MIESEQDKFEREFRAELARGDVDEIGSVDLFPVIVGACKQTGIAGRVSMKNIRDITTAVRAALAPAVDGLREQLEEAISEREASEVWGYTQNLQAEIARLRSEAVKSAEEIWRLMERLEQSEQFSASQGTDIEALKHKIRKLQEERK